MLLNKYGCTRVRDGDEQQQIVRYVHKAREDWAAIAVEEARCGALRTRDGDEIFYIFTSLRVCDAPAALSFG